MKLSLILLVIGMASAVYKMADMWQAVKDMNCLGGFYDVFLFRAYKETCAVDANAKPNFLKCNAVKRGGCAFYITPVSKCDATAVVTDMCSQVIEGTSMRFAIIVDVADPPKWSSDTAANRVYLEALIAALNARSNDCVYWVAIQTNRWEFQKIFGADYTGMSSLRLMWEFIDRSPVVEDGTWVDFGGWTAPFAKQYDKGLDVCDNSLDPVSWGLSEGDAELTLSAPIDG